MPRQSMHWISKKLRLNGALLLVMCLQAMLVLPFLMDLPPIDNAGDESWMMNISWSILENGRATAPMHVGTPISDSPSIATQWLYNGLLSLAIIVGGNNIISGRLLSFIASLGLVALVYVFGRRMRGESLGMGAALILACSIFFSFHSREARPEMVFALTVLAAVFYFYRAIFNDGRPIARDLFIAGLLVTLSVEAHPNGACFAAAMLVAYPIYFHRNLFSRNTLSLLGGMALGTALWVVLNYLPMDMSSFATIHSKYVPPVLRGEFFSMVINGLISLPDRYLSPEQLDIVLNAYYSTIDYVFIYAILALSLISLIVFKENRKQKLFILLFIFLPTLAGILFVSYVNWMHYFVYMPLLALSTVFAFYDIAKWAGAWRKLAYVILTGSLCIYGLLDISLATSKLMSYEYGAIRKELREAIPDGSRVMGTGLYYFSFTDRPDNFMSYLFIEKNCPDFARAIRVYRPDFILIDSPLYELSSYWCPLPGDKGTYFNRSILGFIKKNATLAKELNIPYPSKYGSKEMIKKTYVYRVNTAFYE